MAGQPPYPPQGPGPSPEPGERGAPGGADFPGAPGGPVPPGWGGPGAPGPAGGGRPGRAPGPPAPAARWWLVGGVGIGGAVALAVVGGILWSLTAPGPPYTVLADCRGLLPPEAITEIPELAGGSVEGEALGAGETAEAAVLQQVECWSVNDDEDASGLMTVSLRRYGPQTRESEYVTLQRALDRERRELTGGLAEEEASARHVEIADGVVADIRLRSLGLGQDGYAAVFSNAEDDYGTYDDMDSWAVAHFYDRNVMVQIMYQGAADMPPEAKLDTATAIAELVDRRLGETAQTA